MEEEAISMHGAADHRGAWASHQQGLRQLINLFIHQKLNVWLGRVLPGPGERMMNQTVVLTLKAFTV